MNMHGADIALGVNEGVVFVDDIEPWSAWVEYNNCNLNYAIARCKACGFTVDYSEKRHGGEANGSALGRLCGAL